MAYIVSGEQEASSNEQNDDENIAAAITAVDRLAIVAIDRKHIASKIIAADRIMMKFARLGCLNKPTVLCRVTIVTLRRAFMYLSATIST